MVVHAGELSRLGITLSVKRPDRALARMATPDDAGDKKLSRRRFIKWAGGSLAAGTAAVALGSAAAGLLTPNIEKAAASPIARRHPRRARRPRHPPPSRRHPNPADALAEGAFSIFWITDTQFLSESNPALFKMLNNWIVDNWARFNGKMVIHTGDVVQNGPVDARVVERRRRHVGARWRTAYHTPGARETTTIWSMATRLRAGRETCGPPPSTPRWPAPSGERAAIRPVGGTTITRG